MRILYVTQIVPYPPHGGVLQRGYNLLKHLGKAHEVQLLAFHHVDELPFDHRYEHSLRELGRFCSMVEYFPLLVKRSRALRVAALAAAAAVPFPYSVLAHRSRSLARRIGAICAGPQRPDVVHLDTIGLAPYARHCNGIPTILAHHNVESQLMARRASVERSALARLYVHIQAERLLAYERSQCPRFASNIMVSERDAATLRSLVGDINTSVVPNGVDTEYFVPTPPVDDPVMIYTGGMNMFANRDAVEWFLTDIWPLIKAEVPNARFIAVGGHPSPKVLAAARADASIEAPGYVPDVRPWVSRASVFVVPLRVGGGTRLKILDAMAQGKAIVTTRIGAEGIDGTDGEHFAFADDAPSFAETTVRLLRDAERRAAMGAAARAQAETRYAWPLLAEKLARTYSEVAQDWQ